MTKTPQMDASTENLVKTGIAGLDDVLGGGLTPNRLYLIEGVPGSGKTTLSWQFLLEGARRGEPVLYVTLSETEEEIKAVAASHGWSLEGVTIRELAASNSDLLQSEQYTMFHPSEVELTETAKKILSDVEQLKPRRVVFDSMSELRLLAANPLRYRRQILAFKQFFSGRNCTTLLLDDMTAADRDLQVQSIAHGVILLEQTHPEYGVDRRRLRVIKYRGHAFRGGHHDYLINRGGLVVFPRLVASEHRQPSCRDKMGSGISALDSLMGGGIERGSSTLIVGAAGTGKSTLAAQYCAAAAERGQHVAMFIFDETIVSLTSRTEGLGIPLKSHIEAGTISVQQIDPAELSPANLSTKSARPSNATMPRSWSSTASTAISTPCPASAF